MKQRVVLTPQQKNILRLIEKGLTIDEIAEELGIKKNTVYRTISLARHWNNLTTTYQLMIRAQRDGALAEDA